ncbi:MAG: hypothetical protein K2X48_00105 [Chitinophagaceae bacterium]|nr:hypothetical protein [Chitinophagaceae bacterium]
MKTGTIAEKKLEPVEINNETFYKISDVDAMRPFFMSIVSDSNHWMFVSSNGGISAGRKNAEFALFPYYTDDKITESSEVTGSKTILVVTKNNHSVLWEPFSVRSEGRFAVSRNLYQNKWCNKILFEEINHDLQLAFQYEWSSSNLFGFVKQAKLINLSNETVEVQLADGLQNIMPFGVPAALQTTTSNLADAYKRSELMAETGLGIFALSAIIVDKAEPAEALKANIAWSLGLDNPTYLLSSLQLQNLRTNNPVKQEEDVKGEKGAYFVVSTVSLAAGAEKKWMLVANVNQNHSSVIALSEQIKNDKNLAVQILEDVEAGTLHLQQLTGAADSFQYTADDLKDTRHYSNVLFNIMRGGIFDNNYQIEKWDFSNYLHKANKKVFEASQSLLANLKEEFSLFELKKIAGESGNSDFIRLATEYLPLKFSRRHGDPSRPWNQFSINTRSEIDGSKILDYQGNWRDIFQNWEALAHSYPEFIDGMISKFLNASTFDGYNPYRVTKDGFDWETIEPDNPWSYIGYWGDHQIIYLLKFLEFAQQHQSGAIEKLLNENNYVYANVPYRIKSYNDIVKNPKDTIEFDHHNEKRIHERIHQLGADGALLTVGEGDIYRVNFAEKILATVLSKLSNFVPEGGIWMNTQRPEWNDANNALVGNGVSMVTLYYLRRFLKFLQGVVENSKTDTVSVSAELHLLFTQLATVFSNQAHLLNSSIDNKSRKKITDELGIAGSNFRNQIYEHGFSGKKENLSNDELAAFVKASLQFVEHSIKANKRKDNLYHAYNLLSFENDELKISYLSEMLEGQVGVLSSEQLTATESLQLLDALKQSSLYRKDQNSYILYPNKNLKGFLERNNIPADAVEKSQLLKKLVADNNVQLIEKDVNGNFHFNGNFKNAEDVLRALNGLGAAYQLQVAKEKALALQIFEEVFNHKEFTGRSGTFYAFEGLGSIYWHMVSKLSLAVMETCLRAIRDKADAQTISSLVAHYYEISAGIGVHKSPQLFGAFPVTPYSHTPMHKGAQQPGMTGQVKEDILTRMAELGVKMKEGALLFEPGLLLKNELLQKEVNASFVTIDGSIKNIVLKPNSLAFTICQVPVVYKAAASSKIEVFFANGSIETVHSNALNSEMSRHILHRTGTIDYLEVYIDENSLR